MKALPDSKSGFPLSLCHYVFLKACGNISRLVILFRVLASLFRKHRREALSLFDMQKEFRLLRCKF